MGAKIICSHCGGDRDVDLVSKCPSCGSRQYPVIGYLYPHEGRTFLTAAAIIVFVLVLALAIGVIYVRSAFFF